eukprot:11117971-Alexandrium_andersonii.AAC.1
MTSPPRFRRDPPRSGAGSRRAESAWGFLTIRALARSCLSGCPNYFAHFELPLAIPCGTS